MSERTADPASTASTAPAAARGNDWASETAELIERTVGNVRARVVEPAENVARVLVMGTLVALVGAALLALVVIGAFHGLVIIANAVTPAPHDNAWIAWLVLGGILLVAGALLWSKRAPAGR